MVVRGMLRGLIKRWVPRSLVEWRQRRLVARIDAPFKTKSPAETFEIVYREGLWGRDGHEGFYSGPGSHDEGVVTPYVEAVARFLSALPRPPRVVDLGCGDFNVGRQLRPFAASYIACDVVPGLIERNERKYRDLDVDFRTLDISAEALPGGDVVFVRQVLQHLSNAQVARVLPKLGQFAWAIVTEHVPSGHFVPNLDKPAGPGMRLAHRSGVVIGAPPFRLPARSERELCAVPNDIGAIRTIAFELGH